MRTECSDLVTFGYRSSEDTSLNDIQIRRLETPDVSRFRQLLRVFGTAFFDSETYEGDQPDDDYVTDLLADDGFIAIGAFDGDRATGGLAAYVLRKFEQPRKEIYIYDLAVEASYRRQGIATGLIGHLRSLAAEIGAYVIFVQADNGDEAAISLYTGLGIREDVLHFDIEVSGS